MTARKKSPSRPAAPKAARKSAPARPAKPKGAPKSASKAAPKAKPAAAPKSPRTTKAAAPARPAAPVLVPRTAPAREKDIMEIDWALFGELSRVLALKVARAWDPDLVVGIATAGVIPGATIAAILDCEFHSMVISRRYHAETVRATPAVFGQVPAEVRGQHVLIVDETCDSGDTMRLAVAACLNGGAADVRTAVAFRTGSYQPDFVALEAEAEIILPWDREILVDGELVPNPAFTG